jgi:hypothetical protein
MSLDTAELAVEVLSEQEMVDAIGADQEKRAGRPCPPERGVSASYLPSQKRLVLSAAVVSAMSPESLRVLLGHELTHAAQHQNHPQLFSQIEVIQQRLFTRTASPDDMRTIMALSALQEGHAIYTQTQLINKAPRPSAMTMPTGEQMIERAYGEKRPVHDPMSTSAIGYWLMNKVMDEPAPAEEIAALYQMDSGVLAARFNEMAQRWHQAVG